MIPSADQHDFESFVRSSSDRLVRTAYLLTGDAHEAEDLVQAALVRTARQWRRARSNPHPYARKVIVNLVKDRWRHLGRRPKETADEVADLALPSRSAEREIENVHQRDLVLRVVHALPPQQRAVVVLRFLEDLTVEETARALGCTTGTVKTHSSRGLQRLRSVLEDEQGDGGGPTRNETEERHAHR